MADALQVFVKRIYRRPADMTNILVPLPRYQDVGNTAWALVNELLPLCCGTEKLESAEDARAIGWLLHAIDRYGCTFEELTDHAPLQVVYAVSQISADNRLTYPRRVLDRLSRISQSTAVAQIAVFSEILLQTENLSRLPAPAEPSARENIRLWVDEQVELLQAMHAFRVVPTAEPMLTALRESLVRVNKRRRVCQKVP
ncbi:hypothetical protein E6Q11_06800 [Candidatus Dojkabacteria bacterium]|uniref:Uncharacterized protein n=1 Tax=Candidatus Dojkabacteria bacterium TaxID=2099670 RepID=A0A5C7J2M9_9BACT|nr:MAG: hypothetical protein E6Q11_06800 [Candidatus Dojkabacteria bacterium]